MFYLKRQDNNRTKILEESQGDDFGWWLNNRNLSTSSKSCEEIECRSSGSSSSMLSCVDSDDTDNYSLAREYKQDSYENEKIEISSLICDDLDLDLIEQDAATKDTNSTPLPGRGNTEVCNESEWKSHKSYGVCYTPERLVRSQEYRILAPSPLCLLVPQKCITPENENPRKTLRCRRQLNCLIDRKQIGATQLKILLESEPLEIPSSTPPLHRWKTCKRANDSNISENATDQDKSDTDYISDLTYSKHNDSQSPDSISKTSSYGRLNLTFDDCKQTITRSSSPEDTSGVHSNDWSSETPSDLQNTSIFLCDERAITSTDCKASFPEKRSSTINEVVSILQVLETEPNKSTVLLEEDRFCDSTSSHDQLTRLALAIETDASVPGVFKDPGNLVHLQRKVEKLQASSKDIYRDICNLRESFQRDEKRITDLSVNTTKLREDVHELRYLDDLLNLLRGELERISERNWPFLMGHSEHNTEDLNLIV